MTREEARKAAEVMLAYADGKEIECRKRAYGTWSNVSTSIFNWSSFTYRIKREPKYRPFKDAEECWQEMKKHQPFGWVKDEVGEYHHVCSIMDDYFCAADESHAYQDEWLDFTFADDMPFGIKE